MANRPDLTSALAGAQNLLGWKLARATPRGRISGYIVETEAYTEDDPASHAFGGLKNRNASLFAAAGTIYVYFTYGMHYCVNIVTGKPGHGEGVLIRALQPDEGLDLMIANRGLSDQRRLTNGPAKLARALGLDKSHDGQIINGGEVHLEPGFKPETIVRTTRVGISQAIDQPWRFYIAGNPFVSGR